MNQPGINSFEEFLLYYFFAGIIVGALWVILEADIVLGPVSGEPDRRATRLRLTRALAPLGIVHVGFALIAADAARASTDEDARAHDDHARRRAAIEARAFLALGVLALAALTIGMHR